VGDVRHGLARRQSRLVVALAMVALIVLLLSGCGGSTADDDPFVGDWIGAGKGQMTLVQIAKEDGTYTIVGNPDVPVGKVEEKDGSLIVESHAVVMTFTPATTDKLTLEFTGDMFKQPQTVSLKRVDETAYADAATAYNLSTIKSGLAMWKAGGGEKYPPPKEVTPSGLLGKMIRWPNNLFTGKPMEPGQNKGDYTYTVLDGGEKYSLIGYLSDGSTIGE